MAFTLILTGITGTYRAAAPPTHDSVAVCNTQASVPAQSFGQQVRSFFSTVLETDSWPDRWHCGSWTSFHGWLYILSDLMIWLSYFAIPVILASFIYRKQAVLPVNSAVLLFIGFILACGLTHFLDALIFWWPAYRLSALLRFITAGVSVGAVLALVRATPKILEFKSPEHLEKLVQQRTLELLLSNRRLEEEIQQRKQAEEEVQRLNRSLEARIEEKTHDLQELNDELQQTNIELNRNQQITSLAIEASAIGIGLVSLEGRWLQVNKALLDIVGYTEGEMLERDFQTITHPDDLAQDLVFVKELFNGQRAAYQMDKRYIHKNGTIVWIQLNVSLVRDNQNTPLYYIAQIQDITERLRVQQAMIDINTSLEVRTQKLEALNAELEAFTYSVSHDLRAPLRSIGGYSQILEEDYYSTVDEEGKKVIRAIVRNAGKMGRLIDDLLEFSRLGRKEMGLGSLDMRVVVEPLVRDMVAAEKDRVITYTVQAQDVVRVDFHMIKLVWTNLISNALKYTRKSPAAHIEIGSYTRDNEICFYIRDNGIGFNMDYIDKLYGVFQRLHRLDEFEGTGVGLAFVKRIINRHGGHVWAEGRENDGATFYFSLPR